jgi:hypothetical protein
LTAGIKANNDGSAAIQVGGTDYITISSAGAVAIPVSLTVGGVPAGGNYILNSYTSPNTWDATAKKAAGLKAIKVTVVGAGGGAGGSTPGPTTFYEAGAGGGGTAIVYLNAPAIPGPVVVTAGPGTNSFGPLVSATAGATGGTSTSVTTQAGGAGGTGAGPASPGTVLIPGQTGAASSPSIIGSSGGSSLMGFGGPGPGQQGTPGTNGTGYGGGGSGLWDNSTSVSFTRGAGAPGIVIIEEFY